MEIYFSVFAVAKSTVPKVFQVAKNYRDERKATSERHCGWCTECTNQVFCSRCTNPIMLVQKVHEKTNPAFRYVCRRCGAYKRSHEVLDHYLGHLPKHEAPFACHLCEVRKNSDKSMIKHMEKVHHEKVCDLTFYYGTHQCLVHDVVKKTKFDLTLVEPSDIVLSRSNQRVDYNAEAKKQEEIITAVGNSMRSLRILDDIREFDVEKQVAQFREQLLEFERHEKIRRGMEAGGGKRKADAL